MNGLHGLHGSRSLHEYALHTYIYLSSYLFIYLFISYLIFFIYMVIVYFCYHYLYCYHYYSYQFILFWLLCYCYYYYYYLFTLCFYIFYFFIFFYFIHLFILFYFIYLKKSFLKKNERIFFIRKEKFVRNYMTVMHGLISNATFDASSCTYWYRAHYFLSPITRLITTLKIPMVA